MVVIKWSDAIKGPRVKVDGPLCGGLYKEDHGSIVPWSETDPYSDLNWFTWSKEDNDWIVPMDQYNEEFKNWRGPFNNDQLRPHTPKKKRRTERKWSKFSVSFKFNVITRKGNLEILIKSYTYQWLEHMIRDVMWDVFSLLDPSNKEKKLYLLLHQFIFPLDYTEHHVKIIQKCSK